MNKVLIMAVAALSVLSCGARQTDEQIAEAYGLKMTGIEDAYKAAMEALQEGDADDPAVQAKSEALYEETAAKVIALASKTIRKNPDSEVAVTALKDMYYFAEPEQVEAAIARMGESAKADPFVQKVSGSIQARKGTREGQMFTDFTVVQDPADEQGSTVRLSDYVGRGKYVLVDFWASWCGPCRREIPNIAKVYEKYAGDDFTVLGVAVWDKPEDTAAAVAELGMEWDIITNAQKVPTDIYGIDGIPHIILFGADGTILKRGLRGDDIEAEVAKYVKAK